MRMSTSSRRGVAGWVVKPVEIDDVARCLIDVNRQGQSTRCGASRRNRLQRLSALPDVSRAVRHWGEPRAVRVELNPERLRAYDLSPRDVQRALAGANVSEAAGEFTRNDRTFV